MADLEERVPKPLILIAGMLNTKDPVGFFKPFAGLARRVYTVPVPGSNASRDPVELAAMAEAAGLDSGSRRQTSARRSPPSRATRREHRRASSSAGRSISRERCWRPNGTPPT